MKKRFMLLVAVFTLAVFVFLPTTGAMAHELWIETKEMGGELRVDVLWGHRGDIIDQANIENYQLFVRYPGGQVKELELEKAGVWGRGWVEPKEAGEYVFWALRQPGTFTPGDGITRLSVQMAKGVYQHGAGPGTSAKPVDILMEIVPLSDLGMGTFKGKVLLDGQPVADAAISAFGPAELSDHTETARSGADGTFEVNVNQPGIWIVKANVTTDETGTLDETEYAKVSRTTTLLFVAPAAEAPQAAAVQQAPVTAGSPIPGMAGALVVGLVLGALFTSFAIKKK